MVGAKYFLLEASGTSGHYLTAWSQDLPESMFLGFKKPPILRLVCLRTLRKLEHRGDPHFGTAPWVWACRLADSRVSDFHMEFVQ